jgi:hypothetical protein
MVQNSSSLTAPSYYGEVAPEAWQGLPAQTSTTLPVSRNSDFCARAAGVVRGA